MKALAIAVLSAFLAQPHGLSTLHYPQASLVDLGGPHLVAENDEHALLTGVQIFVGGGLARQAQDAGGVAALTAETILRTPVREMPTAEPETLQRLIAESGGTLTYTVEARSVHYYLEGRPERMPLLLNLFGQALSQPDFSITTVDAARKELVQRANDSQANPLAVGLDMFKRAYYSGSAGSSALGNPASLQQVDRAVVARFYADTYKRDGVSVSAAGRVTPTVIASLRTLMGAFAPGVPAPIAATAHAPQDAGKTRIVARRDVAAPFLVLGFSAPSPTDKDFGAMLLLDSLLANTFDRSDASTPRLTERTISAFYLYDGMPAGFVVFINGSRIDATLGLRELDLVLTSLAKKPLDEDVLEHFKAAAAGSFLNDTLTLSDRSYLIGILEQDGLGADAINAALDDLRQTTTADVQRVAKQYLQKYIVAAVLPRDR